MDEKDLEVRGKRIRIKEIKGNEMFSMTDIANQFGEGRASDKLFSWFKNHNTLDFLEAFEEENKNAFRLEDFELATNSPFVSARNKGDGAWAIFEISSEFMMWIHAKFKVWFMKDYKRMKLEERTLLLKTDKFLTEKNVDNLLESLRNEQDRLENINKELES